jgi:hypothetical protein
LLEKIPFKQRLEREFDEVDTRRHAEYQLRRLRDPRSDWSRDGGELPRRAGGAECFLGNVLAGKSHDQKGIGRIIDTYQPGRSPAVGLDAQVPEFEVKRQQVVRPQDAEFATFVGWADGAAASASAREHHKPGTQIHEITT